MGFNNENGQRMVFDVETAPLEDASAYLVEPVEAPANYKDQAKIAAFIEEAKAKQLDKCSFDADLCRVVAISAWLETDDRPFVKCAGEWSEVRLLEMFWILAKDRHLVGFNCLAFDLPVLLRRSLYLGVKTPLLQIDKFKHPEVTDLMTLLSFNGALKAHSLSFYAKRFGCEVEDALTGEDIGLAVAEGRWDDVEAHVTADVRKTAFVASKCGYFTQAAVGVF